MQSDLSGSKRNILDPSMRAGNEIPAAASGLDCLSLSAVCAATIDGLSGLPICLTCCPGAFRQRLASVVGHIHGASSTSKSSRTSLNLDCHAQHGAVAHEASRSDGETGTCRTLQDAPKRARRPSQAPRSRQLWRDPQPPRPTVAQPAGRPCKVLEIKMGSSHEGATERGCDA